MACCNYLDVYLYIIVFKTVLFLNLFIISLSFALSFFLIFFLSFCQSSINLLFRCVSLSNCHSFFSLFLPFSLFLCVFFFGLSALLPACLAGCLSACLPAFHSSRLPFILCFFPQICLPMYADVRGLPCFYGSSTCIRKLRKRLGILHVIRAMR